MTDTPDPRPLTPAQRAAYVRSGYTACPYCKSSDVVGHPPEVDCNYATQEVTCSECGRGWTDVYTLTSIVED
jgi:transposase-like protein